MEVGAALRSPVFLFQSSELGSRSRSLLPRCANSLHLGQSGRVSYGSVKGLGLPLQRPQRPSIIKRNSVIRASMSSSSPEPTSSQIAPLQFESPVGQFLSQILASHPHLLPAAVEQQLEQLQTDREAEKSKEEPSPSGNELVLYRRIAEVKEKERRRALEEILYTLVVQKFVESGVSLAPALVQSTDASGRVDNWVTEEGKLERLHSPEAYEMIENHLTLILGNRFSDSMTLPPISKLRVGQVYAASVMYGYFLKRVDQRFQLEKSMKSLPGSEMKEVDSLKQPFMHETQPSADVSSSHPEVSSWPSGFAGGGPSQAIKPCRLRSYVLSFDADTLQRYATVRSKEAFSIIEKHTEALFGRPEILITPNGTIDSSKDDLVQISFSGLKRLILEAVTFGSFLWDVESFVDSRYHFVTN
ncbi:hypothetical protein FCM35_KLT15222 [Carex littledalei]|uniref:UV-B-induced protein n=1 Tax=Carex littledalei TaxID=544730 RepID=A0A833QHU2_9POAL|nr:hypothetical protein FCM35_KLT15222 [Carex littledalei]